MNPNPDCIVEAAPLMQKYLLGKPDLTEDEKEILLFALYLESLKSIDGIAAKAYAELRAKGVLK